MKKSISIFASILMILGSISCNLNIDDSRFSGYSVTDSGKNSRAASVTKKIISIEKFNDCNISTTDLGNWQRSVNVLAENFAGMSDGDYVIIKTEANYMYDDRQLQMSYIDGNGSVIIIGGYGSLSDSTYLGEWNCYTLYSGNQETKFYPNKNEIELIKKYGLLINGKAVKITSVKVRTVEYEEIEEVQQEVVTVNGVTDCNISAIDLGNWQRSASVESRYFSDLNEGDYIAIASEANYMNDDRQLQMSYIDGNGNVIIIGGYGSLSDSTYLGEWNCYTLYSGNQVTKFYPNGNEVSKLRNYGLLINGKAVKITSVKVIHAQQEEASETPAENQNQQSQQNQGQSQISQNTSLSSVDFAKSLTIGWNLGNALDASSCGDWAYSEGLNLEYSWLPHKQKASRDLIRAVSAAGFKTLRLPVSWHNHMSRYDDNYTIDSEWMNRVQEIVDWAMDEGMSVILNIHHDNLTESEISYNPGFVLSTNYSNQEKSKAYIAKVWAQIAERFKNYGDNLIFEILNEPRCVGTDYEWGFYGNNEYNAKTYCEIITAYEQVGLDTIRRSGGNNATRFVMCPGYAASPVFLNYYSLPNDSANDKLLLSVHAYTPTDFALEGNKSDYDSNRYYIESSIDDVFNKLTANYVNWGRGVVMGEASASDKNNLSSREKWAKYYFAKAHAAGIPVVLWDNEQACAMGAYAGGENHGYFNRVTCEQTWPGMLKIMMDESYGNSSGNVNQEQGSVSSDVAFTVNYTGKDGGAIFATGSDWISVEIEFAELKEGMLFKVESDALKEDHGDWKEYYTAYFEPEGIKTTIVLADVLAQIKKENASEAYKINKISTVCIQNTKNGANTFRVKKATVTKSNYSVTEVIPAEDGWNATVNR